MKTCAKINLFLKVHGTRADGYHELETVFLPIYGLCDDVTVTPSEKAGLSISCNMPELETDGNLCLKAARAFCDKTGLPQGFHVELVKRIPVAAGLGGGSSDAAATILQLNRFLQKPFPDFELRRIAASIGADIPFFVNPSPSAATGIGDLLSPITVSANLDVLVVSPGIPIPVKWAYDAYEAYNGIKKIPSPAADFREFRQACESASAEDLAKLCHNDLEYAIFDKFPLIAMMRDHLLAQGALCVHVSGSGSSLFALLPHDRRNIIRDDFANAFQDVSSMTMFP